MLEAESTNEYDGVNEGQTIPGIQLYPDFNPWFLATVKDINPHLIVGIARGAIRLLQTHEGLEHIREIPLISHHALPFIPDEEITSKRILLFDDSVIFGSTMADTRTYLLKRGAIVFCASFVVDRYNYYGEPKPGSAQDITPSPHSDMPLEVSKKLWPDEIRRHHNILTKAVLQTPTHYNLDFPTFAIKIPGYKAEDIPYFANLISSSNHVFRGLYDVSPSESILNMIYRFTLLLTPLNGNLFSNKKIYCRPYSKIRLIFAPRQGEIRVIPIIQLMFADQVSFNEVIFTDSVLQKLWKKLKPPVSEDDPFYEQALFRLLTIFLSTIVGASISRKISESISDNSLEKRVFFVKDDVQCIVGQENSQVIEEIWEYFGDKDFDLNQYSRDVSEVIDYSEPVDSKLIKSVSDCWKRNPRLKPSQGELVYEMLGKIFLTLAEVTDSSKCRIENSSRSRLEVGLSYESIRILLEKECGVKISPNDISLGIDLCVDNGQGVPKVVRQDLQWLRAFYSGERKDTQIHLQVKNAMHREYSRFMKRKGAEPLSKFDIQKLCVTMQDLIPSLPFSTKYTIYGKTAYVDESDVIYWLTEGNTAPMELSTDKEKGPVLLPKERYRNIAKPTWGAEENFRFNNAFQHLALAFNKLQSKTILLISTCRTHRHTFNAVTAEAHCWVGSRGSYNFLEVLTGIEVNEGFITLSRNTISYLHRCIRNITEAYKKYKIFHRDYSELMKRLHDAFAKQGNSGLTFWEYLKEKRIFDLTTEEEITFRFKIYLMPLIRQMRNLTKLITGLLIETKSLSLDELDKVFKTEAASIYWGEYKWLRSEDFLKAAYDYNRNVTQGQLPGVSIIKTTFPIRLLDALTNECDSKSVSEMLEVINTCFFELKKALESFCPEYNVNEGDFPYSPTGRKLLFDGSEEKILHNCYQLTMDIIGSTDSPQTDECKQNLRRIFSLFKGGQPEVFDQEILFELTGNDAFLICSKDPKILYDIAIATMLEGYRWIEEGWPFGGTRKGLYFGNVKVIVTPKDSVIIQDAFVPHTIPRAFYILPGIDEHYQKCCQDKNSAILIEKRAAELVGDMLQLKLTDETFVPVQSKHFVGDCYILNLRKLK